MQIRNLIISTHPKELKFPKSIANREELEKECALIALPKYYKLKFDKVKYNQFISMFQNNDKSLRLKLESTCLFTQTKLMRVYRYLSSTSPG